MRRSAIVAGWCAFGVLFGQSGDDFALTIEEVSVRGDEHTVNVVGSWKVGPIGGWAWAICHDPVAVSIGDCMPRLGGKHSCTDLHCPGVECPSDLLTASPQGEVPGYVYINLYTEGMGTTGIGQVVLCDSGPAPFELPANDGFCMLTITYALKTSASRLDFCDTLPPGLGTMAPSFTLGGARYPPAVRQGITLFARDTVKNGDVNGSGAIDIADAIYLLSYLFAQGPPPKALGTPQP